MRCYLSFSKFFQLLLFAEGTRYTPAKHAASVEFARKAGLPPLQHLLLPRTKGFLSTLEQLRGKFPAIYSCTLAFNTLVYLFTSSTCELRSITVEILIYRDEGAPPTLKNMLLGRRVMGEMLLERVPLEKVPKDVDKASDWLQESYRQKVIGYVDV